MSYVRRVLLPGETIIYETGLHWLVYSRAILLLLVAIGAGIGSSYLDGDPRLILEIIAAAFLALAIIAAVIAGIRRASTQLAVTDQRVIFKRGVFSRHTIEMNRSKVESVDVDQSVLGRILNYGTVLVRGTGGSLEPLHGISDPLTFRSYITAEPVRHGAAG